MFKVSSKSCHATPNSPLSLFWFEDRQEKQPLLGQPFPITNFCPLITKQSKYLFALEDPSIFYKHMKMSMESSSMSFNTRQTATYIKLTVIINQKRPGYFVFDGSQNFLVNKAITESLAAGLGFLTCFPYHSTN